MDDNLQDTTATKHPPRKRVNILVALVAVVGGGALFFGVMAWYFTRVDKAEFQQPKAGGSAKSGPGTPATKDGEELVMGAEVIDIVPLAEMHVTIKSGKVESVEVPKDSGLTAKVEGDAVTISASQDAKEGTHQVTVKDCKGKKAIIRVNLKVAKPVPTPNTSEHP